MSLRSVSTTRRADEDIASAVDFLFADGRPGVASDFIEALEQAFALISEHPAFGSQRLGEEAGIPGVRGIGLRRWPYVAFYLDSGAEIRVVRVLHTRRDLLAELDPDSAPK